MKDTKDENKASSIPFLFKHQIKTKQLNIPPRWKSRKVQAKEGGRGWGTRRGSYATNGGGGGGHDTWRCGGEAITQAQPDQSNEWVGRR